MDAVELDVRLAAATEVARHAGDLGLRYFADRASLAIERKGLQDVVSVADRAVETLIREELTARFPDDAILGEEAGGDPAAMAAAPAIWVVDPIDGTASFLSGMPLWCVSIACVVDGRAAVGVVRDPNADETYAGRKGGGARLNGAPLEISASTSLADGMLGVGYSTRSTPADVVPFMERLLSAGGMFHRIGSGALSLAYVAAGRLIGYYEPHINSWDCLAGIVLVEEAGGWSNDFLAGDGLMQGGALAAAAPGVTSELRALTGL